ncbi:MAG: extracellular solute-binding protein family 1 [Paenibacillus sp.]|jgi:multiple sugar transport system substrate-binding protein|nr:extracellular solute-binding protein family 1 [Paenibacillus sp.]
MWPLPLTNKRLTGARNSNPKGWNQAMWKKSVSISMLGMMILLSACGSKESAAPANGAEAKQEPVELTVYYPFVSDWTAEDFMKTFAEPIKQKYPHLSLKYIFGGTGGMKLEDVIASGQKVDIMFASYGSLTPWDYDMQYDITPLIQTYKYDLSKIDPSMVDIQKKVANGGIYGLPVYVPPSVIYYNKDIFDKFGVSYPKDGGTWDDLYELSKKVTRKEGSVQYQAIGTSYAHVVMLNQLSIPLVDTATKKATFNTDPRWNGFVENLTRFYKIPGHELTDKYIANPDERNRFFKDRNVGMFLMLTALAQAKELDGMNWDLASYPVFKDKPNLGPQAYPIYFYVSNQSQHKDQAFQVISYLASEDYLAPRVKEGKLLPSLTNKALKESFGQDNPLYKGKNTKALQPAQYAVTGSVNRFNNLAKEEMYTAIREINAGQKDINTALREATERENKKIQEMESAATAK